MHAMRRVMMAQAAGGGGGGGSRTPHRYWRVKGVTLQSGGSGNFSVGTLEMRTTRGGADQCSGGTPLKDSENGGDVASNAFDGNATTYWSSTTGGSNHYIGYDFGSAKNVEQIRIVGRADAATANATTLNIESSDDNSSWTLEWSHTGLANWSTSEARVLTRPLTTDTNRYWRVFVTANYAASATSIAELELRGTPGGSDIASGATFTADSEFDATVPIANARDGNGATFWTATNTALPHWVKAVFGSPVYVGQVAITARTDVPSLAPASIYIQTCDDDLTWRDSSLVGYASISAGETKLFNTSYP